MQTPQTAGRHYGMRAAVLQAMADAGLTYAQTARRLGWPVDLLTARLGGRGILTGSEVGQFVGAFGDNLGVLEAAAVHELGTGYLYTIECCGAELDVILGREQVCPACSTVYAAHLERAAA